MGRRRGGRGDVRRAAHGAGPAAYFPPPYPADATDVEAVHDIVTAAALPVRRTVYECESCGRLWLQEGPDSSRFRGYAP